MAAQASLLPTAGPPASPARCRMANFVTTFCSTTRQRRRSKTRSAAATKANQNQKKKLRRPSAGAVSVVPRASQIQLITMGHPAIAARAFLYMANAGKGHVKADDEKFVVRKHLEDALACCHRFLFVIVHFEMPLRPLHGHNVLCAGVGSNHETLSCALHMEREKTGRMARGIYRSNAGHNLVAWSDEG